MRLALHILIGLGIWTAVAFPAAFVWGRRLRRVAPGQARKTPDGDQEQPQVRVAH